MLRNLSPPALHHLVSSVLDTPAEVSKSLVERFLARPPFSYKLLGTLVQIAMKADASLAQFDAAVRKHQPPKYQPIFLEITPLIYEHFGALRPKFVLPVEPRKYLINDLEIPFKPPFAFELNGDLVIPWFIFWKSNPLTIRQLSLLVSLIDEMLQQDPDFRDARILMYDFSVPPADTDRRLRITDAAAIPRLSSTEVSKALEIFLDGFRLAQATLASMSSSRSSTRRSDHPAPQFGLFVDQPDQLPTEPQKPPRK